MNMRFKCNLCGKEYSGADHLLGQQALCKKCGKLFTVRDDRTVDQVPGGRPERASGPPPAAGSGYRVATPTRVYTPDALDLDLEALSPLGDAAMATAPAALAGGANLWSARVSKKQKKRPAALWVALTGMGCTGVVITALLVFIVVRAAPIFNVAGRWGNSKNPTDYLPADPILAVSVRVKSVLDRAAAVPQLSGRIERAIAEASADGLNPRDLDEVIVVFDGHIWHLAARLGRPIDISRLRGVTKHPLTSRYGPIYQIRSDRKRRRSAARQPWEAPEFATLYFVMPNSRLVIGASNPTVLDASAARPTRGGGTTLDLPVGHDIVARITDVKRAESLGLLPRSTPNNADDGLLGFTAAVMWGDTVAFEVDITTKDAQTAAQVERRLTNNRQFFLEGPGGPPFSKPLADLLGSLRASVNGSQVHLTGSIPANQFGALWPSVSPAGSPPR